MMPPEVVVTGSNPASGIARQIHLADAFLTEHNMGTVLDGNKPRKSRGVLVGLACGSYAVRPTANLRSNRSEPIGDRAIGIITTHFSTACLLSSIQCSVPRQDSGSIPESTIGVQSPPLNPTIIQRLFFTTAHHSYVAGTYSKIPPPILSVPAYFDYQNLQSSIIDESMAVTRNGDPTPCGLPEMAGSPL